jgi:PBP1b-binding outer membrane lipoprotein LpoB
MRVLVLALCLLVAGCSGSSNDSCPSQRDNTPTQVSPQLFEPFGSHGYC